MKIRFRTETGSLYELDKQEMTWARLEANLEKSPYVRTKDGDLIVWPTTIEVGKPVTMYGTGLTFGYRCIWTSNVTEILPT